MTPRLIVMRHAKSSWTSGAPSDHERPLNKRGRRDAPRIAARLQELDWVPELVISSDSERTRETWRRMAPEFSAQPAVRFTRAFYHAGPGAIESEFADLPRETGTVLVLGHNPGWEHAVEHLTGTWVRMTTANAALLSNLADSWPAAFESTWTLESILRPREL